MVQVTEAERQLIDCVSEWVDSGRARNEGLRRIKENALSCPFETSKRLYGTKSSSRLLKG